MEYITHRRFKHLDANGNRLNIPYGRKFQTASDFIVTPEGTIICRIKSRAAHEFFSRNDDGRGLERGALTHAIAFSNRERRSAEGRRQRFTDAEIEMLEKEWSKFLVPDTDVILFNHDFFNAEPEELKQLAQALNIKA